jgi:hypothetical protein
MDNPAARIGEFVAFVQAHISCEPNHEDTRPSHDRTSKRRPDYRGPVALRQLRRQVMAGNRWSLPDLYWTLETPGKNPLREAHERLDAAVRAAYGMKASDDPLAFLLALNRHVADREAADQPVQGPGLPACVPEAGQFVTEDCVRVEE